MGRIKTPLPVPLLPLWRRISQLASSKLVDRCFQDGLPDRTRPDLFDQMPHKDVVAWTSVISRHNSDHQHGRAWEVVRDMLRGGVEPNEYTMSSALVACRGIGSRRCGQITHAQAVRRGLERWSYVENMLVDMYACCSGGSMEDAWKAFEEIAVKTEVVWTMVIAGYTRSGDCSSAILLFSRMFQEGGKLNPHSCSIAIRACASLGFLVSGRQLHAAAVKSMFEVNLPVANSLVDMYCRCMSFLEAKQYFNEVPQKDLISWNTMISGLVRSNPDEALQLFNYMGSKSLPPNSITLCSIVAACAALAVLNCGQQVHGTIIQRGFGGNLQLDNALIDMYAKCGSVSDSCKIFDEMDEKDVVSWTSLMNGYGSHGYAEQAVKLFNKMVDLAIPLDYIVFVSIISACSHAKMVDEGLRYFNQMTSDYGVMPNQDIYGSVVDLLGRAGRLDEAYELIRRMPFEPDESIWCALLGSCKMHRNVHLGKIAAEKIFTLNQGAATTYVILSNIYAADGEWDEFARMRRMLKQSGSRKEVGRSWIEVKDFVYVFSVEERCNHHMHLVYNVLEILVQHMNDAGYVHDLDLLNFVEEIT